MIKFINIFFILMISTSTTCNEIFVKFKCYNNKNGMQSCFQSSNLVEFITKKETRIKIDENINAENVSMLNVNSGIIMNYFPANLHEIFYNLEEIIAINVDLLEITRENLKNLSNLRVLDLRHNKLKTLEVNLFEGNPLIEIIDLDLNDFDSKALDIRPFMNLKSLIHLSIFNNIFKQNNSIDHCPPTYCHPYNESTIGNEKLIRTASSQLDIVYTLCAFSITQLVVIIFMCIAPRKKHEKSTDNDVQKVITHDIADYSAYETWPKKTIYTVTADYEELPFDKNEILMDYAEVGFNSNVKESDEVIPVYAAIDKTKKTSKVQSA